MAQYETLPIYKLTYGFLLRVMHAVTHYPREYKYTLGERITYSINTLFIRIDCFIFKTVLLSKIKFYSF